MRSEKGDTRKRFPYFVWMMRKVNFLWLVCSFLTIAVNGRGTESRLPSIGIISDGAGSPIVSLLEARISESGKLALVEREELETVGSEKLFSAIAVGEPRSSTLVAADGILLVESAGGREDSHPQSMGALARLIDVATGTILDAYELRGDFSTADSLARLDSVTARIERTAPFLGRVRQVPALSISKFRMRDSSGDFAKIQQGRQFQLLLAHKLQLHENRDFHVIERYRLDEVDFDHQYGGNNSSDWRGSSFQLEGTFQTHVEGNEILYELSLLSDSQVVKSWNVSVTPNNRSDVSESILQELSSAISGNSLEQMSGEELDLDIVRLTQEARWASSAGLFREAEYLLLTAVALEGNERANIEVIRQLQQVRRARLSEVRFRSSDVYDYRGILESAIACSRAWEGQTLTFAENVAELRLFTDVLFYGYRHNFHLDSEISGRMEALREVCRNVWESGVRQFLEVPVQRRRLDDTCLTWVNTVSQSGGLWFDSKREAVNHWQQILAVSYDFCPRVYRGGELADRHLERRFLVPLAIDWDAPFDLQNALTDWLSIPGEFGGSDRLLSDLFGFAVREDVRRWANERSPDSLNKAGVSTLGNFLSNSGISKETVGGLPETLDQLEKLQRSYLGENFFFRALYHDATVRSASGGREWLNEDVQRRVVNFFSDTLLESKVALPFIYRLFFENPSRANHHKDYISVAELTPEQRVLLDRSGTVHFTRLQKYEEKPTHLSEYIAGIRARQASSQEEQAIRIHPDSVMVLSRNLITGYPVEVAGRYGRELTFDNNTRESVYSTILDWRSREKFGGEPGLAIHLQQDSLVEGGDTRRITIPMNVPDYKGFKIDYVFASRLHVVDNKFVLILQFYGENETGACFLISADSETRSYRCHQLAAIMGDVVRSVSDGEGNVFISINSLRAENRGVPIQDDNPEFLRVISYDVKKDEFVVLSDSLRKPARTFLDDRAPPCAFELLLSPARQPMLCSVFFREDGIPDLYRTLLWDSEKKNWTAPEFETFPGRAFGSYFFGVSRYTSQEGNERRNLHSLDGQRTVQSLLGYDRSSIFRIPPPQYLRPPVGDFLDQSGTVSANDAPQFTSDLLCCRLFVRDTEANPRTLILRCYHEELGKAHYDLVLKLENLPKLSNNFSRDKTPVGGRSHKYRWSVRPWQNGVALFASTRENRCFYPIKEEEILAQIQKLKNSEIPLSRFETFVEDRGETAKSDLLLVDAERAIVSGELGKLDSLLKAGLEESDLLGSGRTESMHLASLHGHLDIVNLLDQHGFSMTDMSHERKQPPISYSLRSKNHELVRFFLTKGVHKNWEGNPYNPPLFLQALEYSSDDVIRLVAEFVSDEPFKEQIRQARGVSYNLGLIRAHERAGEILSRISE